MSLVSSNSSPPFTPFIRIACFDEDSVCEEGADWPLVVLLWCRVLNVSKYSCIMSDCRDDGLFVVDELDWLPERRKCFN